jgi:glucokinase
MVRKKTSKSKYALGIDIGGTKIASGLVTKSGKLSGLLLRPTPRSKNELIKALDDIVFSHQKGLPVGIGIAGHVLPREGIAVYSPHFSKGWRNVPLVKILRKKHATTVAINNDANCFAVAENIFGAGKKFRNYISITWGTGIGGAIIINKKLFTGLHNIAGEFGHGILSCRPAAKPGQIAPRSEDSAGGLAMAKLYKKLSGTKISNHELIKKWRQGDRLATRAVETTAHYFGLVLTTATNALNPEAIVLGGGLSAIRGLLEIAKKTFKANYYTPRVVQIPVIRAKLGEYSNVVGAGYIAIHNNY